MDLMLGFVVAMSVTMVLIPPLIRIAGRAHFLDQPNERKVHQAPIPRVGGIAMAVGVLIALAAWGDFDRQLQAYCAGVVILAVFGMWDDRRELSPAMKLLGQALAVGAAMAWGGVTIGSITVSDRVSLPDPLAHGLTFVFLIGVINAINLSDGLDGLAGGMSLLCLGALALLALTVGNRFVGPVALVGAGAILGFLRFNTHPARVFMGDCGSQILGYSVGVLSVALTQDPEVPLSSALPLLLLGVPVIDTLMVMTQRVLAGRSPFRADRTHVHHRLLDLGFDHHEAVTVIYVLQGLLFVVAWLMRFHPDLATLGVFAFACAIVVGGLRLASSTGWRWRGVATPTSQAPVSSLSRRIDWLRSPQRLLRLSGHVLWMTMLFYGLTVAARMEPSPEVRALSAGVAAILLATLIARWRRAGLGWFERGALYLASVAAVYVDYQATAGAPLLGTLSMNLFSIQALALLARLAASTRREFAISPLDLLIIFLAAAVPNLPGSLASVPALGDATAKLVILLYSVEALCVSLGPRWRSLALATLAFLLVCAGGGLRFAFN